MSTELALPTSVRPESWNADTAAMMEFAGLTWIDQRPDPQNPGQPISVRCYAPSGIMAAFIAACARTGLDPTAKQIYAALMGGKWTVLVGIDGMRVVAQRTGEYDGQDPIEWQAAADGPWTTVPPKAPFAARVRVYRKGISRPIEQTVTFAEFGGQKNNWDKRPAHMLGIRAESHALRRLFPMELAGLYTPEDFQDDATDTTDALTAAEPSEPWRDLIEAASDRPALDAIAERLAASGEGTDKLRAAWLARAGVLKREANTVDAEIIADDAETAPEGEDASPSAPPASPSEGLTAEEYEAAEAARFDAAVDAGEVPSE